MIRNVYPGPRIRISEPGIKKALDPGSSFPTLLGAMGEASVRICRMMHPNPFIKEPIDFMQVCAPTSVQSFSSRKFIYMILNQVFEGRIRKFSKVLRQPKKIIFLQIIRIRYL
jgi:hypothetical protein